MSATAVPAGSDRSDFRTIMLSGTKLGLITAVAVVAFLAVSRQVTALVPQRILETLIVLAAGSAVSFLPAQWAVARRTEGIAAAAAIGLWGTVIFMAFDIIVLRPLKAYPWTWDAVGGGSTWWYLPIWWMLGTFVAWMGGILMASQATRGEGSLARLVLPVIVGTVVLAAVARVAGLAAPLPVEAGAGFTITLAVLAAVALARKA
jgi:hypothetical protein